MTMHEGMVWAKGRTFLGHRGAARLNPEPRLPYRSPFLPFLSQAPRGNCKPAPCGSAGFCFVCIALWVLVPP
jgi:hypothetical protein